jgi:cytochrome bd ubiquinol oxidase subunit I
MGFGQYHEPANELPEETRTFARLCAVVALICGWVTTEVGRQPWVVYRVMRTSEAVTGAGGIPVGYATLALVYLGLVLAVAWILGRLARLPLDPMTAPPTAEEA